jgi:ATP-dependent DNA helicase PIF1
MKNLPSEYLELAKVYRQHNARFLRLLDAIRLNRFDREELAEFNERYVPDFHNPGDYLTLTARNARADSINQSELERLPGPAKAYAAKVRGEFNAAVFPADPMLRLKVDAQVMLLKNDYEAGFVNGDIGRVFSLEEDRVVVEIGQPGDASRLVEVGPAEWDIIRYKVSEEDPGKIESEIVGIFEQVPLRLAWAVTIHKAQGKTFDRVIIDLGRGAFEHGQTYVALSRCRTLEGIVLRQPLRPSDVLIDQRVVDYYQQHFL